MDWFIKVLQQYLDFEGRARRTEYWMFSLIYCIGLVFLVGMAVAFSSKLLGLLLIIYFLALLPPSLGVAVRRLHDTGRSGWWLLINLIPTIGGLIFLVFAVLDSQPGSNEYGDNPKD